MVERVSKKETGEGGWKVIYRVIKVISNFEILQGRGEVSERVVEKITHFKVEERGGKAVKGKGKVISNL
jgi:hypothetical protein